jgi:hypothetical protein
MTTLVSFDWAVKKLLRNKANFDVLEGFLSELLNFDVKIEQILESEHHKQDLLAKLSVFDLDILARDYERFKENRWIEKNVTETVVGEKIRDIAKQMKSDGEPVEKIRKYTGLQEDEIEVL